jgi:excinuclease ABC subunit A
MDTLVPAIRQQLKQDASPGPYDALEIEGTLDGLVVVDQAPLGRTPRSTPATYIKVMDQLRKLYAKTLGAQERGWKPGRFSFNAAGGRCETCEGRGAELIEMHFLPDVWITCSTCKGRRYNRETLSVRWKGHSIADVLAMRADEAVQVFSAQRGIRRRLQALCDVGLGYMTLGQPATTLSGGEAQRVKLAAELVSRKGHRLYVLDEPTTGLHMNDVAKLVQVLHRLVDQGHTVITIEHHVDMIDQSDGVVELGPDGGAGGGRILAEGTPDALARLDTPTGKALAAHRQRRAAS